MSPREASRRSRLVGRAVRTALMLVSVALLIRFAVTGLSEIQAGWAGMLAGSYSLLGVALLLELGWVLSLAGVYRSAMIAFGGHLTRSEAVQISMGAFSISRFLPGGGAVGGLFAAREIMNRGNQLAPTVGSMLTSWWISMIVLTLLVLGGITWGAASGVVGANHLVGPLVVLFALLALATAVAAGWKAGRIARAVDAGLSRWTSRLADGIEVEGANVFRIRPVRSRPFRALAPTMGWAALGWILDAAALWVVFLAFGLTLHPAVLLVGYGAVNLISALPELTPGWIGVLEPMLAVVYAGFGVPAGITVLAVLGYRLVSYWLPVVAGLPFALRMLRLGPPRGIDRVGDLSEAAA